jgi:hypothetical protein
MVSSGITKEAAVESVPAEKANDGFVPIAREYGNSVFVEGTQGDSKTSAVRIRREGCVDERENFSGMSQ